MIYASTLFADYTSARTAYSGLLLPEQAWKKYAFAIGRSLVVFPLLSALLLLGADMAVTLTGRISGFTLRHASTLAECMTYTSLPLYHMPVMPYYLVTFVALITLIRSAAGWRQVFTVIAVAVVAVLVVTWGRDRRNILCVRSIHFLWRGWLSRADGRPCGLSRLAGRVCR